MDVREEDPTRELFGDAKARVVDMLSGEKQREVFVRDARVVK